MARTPDGRDKARGARIKALRDELDLTQEALGRRAHVAERTIRDWEQGATITRGNAIALAVALGTTPAVILADLWKDPAGDDGVMWNDDVKSGMARVEKVMREQRRLLRDHDRHVQHEISQAGPRAARIESHLEAMGQTLDGLVHLLGEMSRAWGAPPAREDAVPPVEAEPRTQGSLAIVRRAGD